MLQILDLYCKAGGAAMGYYQACQDLGIDCRIVGVDREPQPNYPFEFHQGDAVLAAYKYARCFDFVHASPPCQNFSASTARFRKEGRVYPNLVPATRHHLKASGRPYVLENVMPAPIRCDLKLCGQMFGLPVIRWRKFEFADWLLTLQPHPPNKWHNGHEGEFVMVFGKAAYRNQSRTPKGWRPFFDKGTVVETWKYAMQMPWAKTDLELAEAIPPPYTRYIFNSIYNQII
mgnify:CR=1 FL=1